MIVDRATGTIEHRRSRPRDITGRRRARRQSHARVSRATARARAIRARPRRSSAAPGEPRYEAMVHRAASCKPAARPHRAGSRCGLGGHGAAHAHRPADERSGARRGDRAARTHSAAAVHRARRRRADAERYQTVYARESGSVAAPDGGTALHAGTARTTSRREACARKWCCTSAPARSSRSRSRIPPST